MNTKKLGNSDLMITPIGFGAWAVGGPWQFGWGEQSDCSNLIAEHWYAREHRRRRSIVLN
jgi:aryl-alcohol dehydrogenase-like predicted oxidoreductase